MMLGVAFQLGLIGVGVEHRLGDQGLDQRRPPQEPQAFNIGRKLALEPRALPRKPEPETWEQLVKNKERILRKTRCSAEPGR